CRSAYSESGIVPFDVILVYMPPPTANVQADYPHGLAFLSYIIASSGARLAILDVKRHSRKSRSARNVAGCGKRSVREGRLPGRFGGLWARPECGYRTCEGDCLRDYPREPRQGLFRSDGRGGLQPSRPASHPMDQRAIDSVPLVFSPQPALGPGDDGWISGRPRVP